MKGSCFITSLRIALSMISKRASVTLNSNQFEKREIGTHFYKSKKSKILFKNTKNC